MWIFFHLNGHLSGKKMKCQLSIKLARNITNIYALYLETASIRFFKDFTRSETFSVNRFRLL